MVIYIVCAIILGILLSGMWFGLNVILEIISSKTKIKFISRYSVVISAIIPTMIILNYNNSYLLDYKSIVDWKSWILLIVTVIITSFIVSANKITSDLSEKNLIWYAIDGDLYSMCNYEKEV